MNPEVEFFFQKDSDWQKEYRRLRSLCLETGLEEELKWGKPCYSLKGKNILLIHGFKDYCALLFHKGALLKDAENMLVQQTENVQSARQLRFESTEEIEEQSELITAYIYEAIEIEKAGLKVKMKKTEDYEMPAELQAALAEDAELKEAFEALTPGRKRGYLLHISSAKRSATRKRRIEKAKPQIFTGKGYNER